MSRKGSAKCGYPWHAPCLMRHAVGHTGILVDGRARPAAVDRRSLGQNVRPAARAWRRRRRPLGARLAAAPLHVWRLQHRAALRWPDAARPVPRQMDDRAGQGHAPEEAQGAHAQPPGPLARRAGAARYRRLVRRWGGAQWYQGVQHNSQPVAVPRLPGHAAARSLGPHRHFHRPGARHRLWRRGHNARPVPQRRVPVLAARGRVAAAAPAGRRALRRRAAATRRSHGPHRHAHQDAHLARAVHLWRLHHRRPWHATGERRRCPCPMPCKKPDGGSVCGGREGARRPLERVPSARRRPSVGAAPSASPALPSPRALSHPRSHASPRPFVCLPSPRALAPAVQRLTSSLCVPPLARSTAWRPTSFGPSTCAVAIRMPS